MEWKEVEWSVVSKGWSVLGELKCLSNVFWGPLTGFATWSRAAITTLRKAETGIDVGKVMCARTSGLPSGRSLRAVIFVAAHKLRFVILDHIFIVTRLASLAYACV